MDNLREEKIQEILRGFRKRTNILYSNLFSEDGFIITIDQAHKVDDEDFHRSVGAICAAIITLAENGIELINEDCKVKEISIQAGNQLDTEAFTIILESVTKDIKLSIVFTSFLNLGIILFELNQAIHRLMNYFSTYQNDKNIEGIQALH